MKIITQYLVAAFVECTLYGIFLLLSSFALICLYRRHRMTSETLPSESRRPLYRRCIAQIWTLRKAPLIVATVLLIVSVTAHLVLSLAHLVAAVLDHDSSDESSTAFLLDLRSRNAIAKNSILFVDTIIGDLVITYRVWLVWGRNYWVIILPVLSLAGLLVAGSGEIHSFVVTQTSVFTSTVGRWITAGCIMTVCTNIYCTVVIAWRIWSVNRALRDSRLRSFSTGTSILHAMAIFVESAAIWTIWVSVYMVWYLTGSGLEATGAMCGPAMIGITFSLITVRVGLGQAHESQRGTVMSTAIQWNKPPATITAGSTSYPPQTFAVSVTRTVELDCGSIRGVPHEEFEKAGSESDTPSPEYRSARDSIV
ncbi:hypothetical protein C8Q80DRAFT_1267623 [Daedaleopsis nitida]|nr:hypothetical protein C8Q80DRAFT_1267623 [Daedaleopsis nitida]